MPIVANEAAAQALTGLINGQPVFVLSHRSIWTFKAATGPNQTPPLAPHEVIAVASGGVLTRTDYSDPSLRIGINNIFIDPTNPAASDENDGLTAATPLQTGRELFRRWGWGNQVEAGPNFATSPDGFMNIIVNSDLVSPDSLAFNVLITKNGSVRIRGGAGTGTIIQPATALTAVTPMNRAAPLGGTRLRLTAGALVWTPFIIANRRGRITTGIAAGATFQVQVDQGGGAADCCPAQTTNEAGFAIVPTTVTPAPGDSFVIEQLIQINLDPIFRFEQELDPAFVGASFANIVGCHIPATPGQNWQPQSSTGVFLNFYQCTINRLVAIAGPINVFFIATQFTEALFWISPVQVNVGLGGGGAIKLPTSAGLFFVWGNGMGNGIDQDFTTEKFPIVFINDSASSNFSTWNCASHGAYIGRFGGVRGSARTFLRGTHWGAGNGGAGVRVASGSVGIGAAQNSTGVGGDFKLGSFFSGWFWTIATAIFGPAAGPLTTSWANLSAAQPAGFGGSAVRPDQTASFVPVEAN
jgi:hypothetical protein